MRRHKRVKLLAFVAALVGIVGLFGSVAWLLWTSSVSSETHYEGGLAARLGQRTERIIVDARDMLAAFDKLAVPRCSPTHLDALRRASIAHAYIRGIGYWHAARRECGVGFLPPEGLKPAQADRIYSSGVIAWWPSGQTQYGGVQLFIMRYGDHDVAIDPRQLLDLGGIRQRQAELWVEGMRMAATSDHVSLPAPDTLPVGVTVDSRLGQVYSHFAHDRLLPIDVVASEPIENFWGRHAPIIVAGLTLGGLLVALWIGFVLRLSRRQLDPSTDLRRALANRQIGVHYQPVIDLRTQQCVGAEALARWQRKDGSWVSPAVFIPVAEASGLIQDVTLAVMQTVIGDLKRILALAPTISVNLNLSHDDLETERISHALAQHLNASAISAHAIKLEITERALVNSDTARAMIRQLRGRGHAVAIDDFGTGYSSLSYLQSFDLDVLKIDKSFVDAIGTGAATSQVIEHVIDMARSLGLETVAEGVETVEQARWLIDHGVFYVQGYLFSKPLALGEFLEFFRKRQSAAQH
ncbi:MAG TPA: EAL domain-containing protein [Rudaea sp.]|nr:EAL domain-containing protein [Rudaea sp.]